VEDENNNKQTRGGASTMGNRSNQESKFDFPNFGGGAPAQWEIGPINLIFLILIGGLSKRLFVLKPYGSKSRVVLAEGEN